VTNRSKGRRGTKVGHSAEEATTARASGSSLVLFDDDVDHQYVPGSSPFGTRYDGRASGTNHPY